ncbi:MAG: acetyl-CoA carboxylase biotin carboxylase subunit [Thermotogae bacterium]|nr:acetyl-CoA carboxylase biotin carboxylase subunit [Thermotogota bacterium]
MRHLLLLRNPQKRPKVKIIARRTISRSTNLFYGLHSFKINAVGREIKRILVANRGEIALRIIYAARELGIETVAIYSEADEESLHVQMADYSVRVGGAAPHESYLNIPHIIAAAEAWGADAIHPGYGFLAENPKFARIVESHGLIFIGPKPEHIELMGDKVEAKRIARRASVPLVPGTDEPVETPQEAKRIAAEIGYPVLLKAAAGGGGRGMRVVESEEEMERKFMAASSEAEVAFGDGRLYLEKFIIHPKHIEVQVFGDEYGNVTHLYDRECSLQRRHQKVLEEAPSPSIDDTKRREVVGYALRLAGEIGYRNAGTVEFLYDGKGNFYFIEMNTRVQVEHPITEMVTGVDIVKAQILLAMGERLPFDGDRITLKGHSIEARINAEDPANNFAPSPGKIELLHKPGGPGVRVDSHIYQGYTIPSYYDSLVAKLITWGMDRREAIDRMNRALEEFVLEGIKTNIPMHLNILHRREFLSGRFYTDSLERWV